MLSIFPSKPVKFEGTDAVLNDASYHFDAIVKYNGEFKATYTRYPIELDADVNDHAYNEPDELVIHGYTGSRELGISLPQLGTSAVLGAVSAVNNPFLSAASGIAASFLAGTKNTRGGATLEFLKQLKEQFVTFDVLTDLNKFVSMKIDSISIEANPDNESGLEFVVSLSQQRISSEGGASSSEEIPNDTAGIDLSIIQNQPKSVRGLVNAVDIDLPRRFGVA